MLNVCCSRLGAAIQKGQLDKRGLLYNLARQDPDTFVASYKALYKTGLPPAAPLRLRGEGIASKPCAFVTFGLVRNSSLLSLNVFGGGKSLATACCNKYLSLYPLAMEWNRALSAAHTIFARDLSRGLEAYRQPDGGFPIRVYQEAVQFQTRLANVRDDTVAGPKFSSDDPRTFACHIFTHLC